LSTRTWLATDYYALLGVRPNATEAEITRAFRDLAKRLHPDRSTNGYEAHQFKELAAAYGVVGNTERRARYDALRATRRRPGAASTAPPPVVIREDDSHRPISVRALPTLRAGLLAYRWGIALFVVGVVIAALVGWITATDDGPTDVARDITFWLIAAKLVIVGAVFWLLGRRRLTYCDSDITPNRNAVTR